jgi:hypothetical protein
MVNKKDKNGLFICLEVVSNYDYSTSSTVDGLSYMMEITRQNLKWQEQKP